MEQNLQENIMPKRDYNKACNFSNIELHIDLPTDTYFFGMPLPVFTLDAVLWSAG